MQHLACPGQHGIFDHVLLMRRVMNCEHDATFSIVVIMVVRARVRVSVLVC